MDKHAETDRERGQLRAYLLGTLPEPYAEVLDERLFDPTSELLAELEEEQQLLIEEFAAGLLNAEEQARFKSQCARSALLRSRAEETRTLLAGLGRAVDQRRLGARAAENAGSGRRWLAMLSPALAIGLCAAALVCVQQVRVNRELRARLAANAAAAAHAQAPQPVLPESGGKEYVAFLAAGVMRDGAASAPHLAVPAGASSVALQVEVHSTAAAWHVTLSTQGHSIWMSDRVPLRTVGDESYLDVHLDAAVLAAGQYSLEFAPVADPRATQTRQFSVDRSR